MEPDPFETNEIPSAQDLALIAATQNLTSLGAILNFCASRPVIGNSCSNAVQLWKQSIARILGPWVRHQRQDLRNEDWYEFAKLIAVGVQFKYCVRNGLGVGPGGGGWSSNALPYGGVAEDPDLKDPDVYYHKFSIPGSIPASGTRGYFVYMTIDGSKYKEFKYFIVGPDMDKNFLLAANYIGLMYADYHVNKLRIREGEFIVDDGIAHPDIGNRPDFPSNLYFIDLVIAAGINPQNGIGMPDGVWIVHYGPYIEDAKERMRIGQGYSETQYEIVPITF